MDIVMAKWPMHIVCHIARPFCFDYIHTIFIGLKIPNKITSVGVDSTICWFMGSRFEAWLMSSSHLSLTTVPDSLCCSKNTS